MLPYLPALVAARCIVMLLLAGSNEPSTLVVVFSSVLPFSLLLQGSKGNECYFSLSTHPSTSLSTMATTLLPQPPAHAGVQLTLSVFCDVSTTQIVLDGSDTMQSHVQCSQLWRQVSCELISTKKKGNKGQAAVLCKK